MAVKLTDLEAACQENRFAYSTTLRARTQDCTRRSAVIDDRYSYAAFFAGYAFLLRDFGVVFFFAPVSSRLFWRTETRSITLVGFGAFLGFSSISFPPASTFSSITSMSASRLVVLVLLRVPLRAHGVDE